MGHRDYSLLICGATFAGLGAAAAALELNRSVLVIERTALVGQEFIEAFNPGRGWKEPKSEFAGRFRQDLLQRNLLEESGPAHLPALHPILCHMIKERELEVRFLTEIIGAAKRNGRYHVTLFDAAGVHEVVVDEILDTSTQRLTQPGQLHRPKRKSLNAYLGVSEEQPRLPAPIDATMEVVPGRFPSEHILKLSVEPGLNWQEARQYMYRYWAARPAEWTPWTIAATAGVFETEVPVGPHRLDEGWTWLPSEGFAHPLEAMDQGYIHERHKEGVKHANLANE